MTPEYMKADGKLYQLVNHYCLPDDGWSVELTEMGENGGGLLHVLIPDEDANRPCEVHITSDAIPLEVLQRTIEEIATTARHAGMSLKRTRASPPD